MQSVAIAHHQASHSGLRVKGIVKFVIPILFLLIAVAIYELSTIQLVMLALVSVLVLALFSRVENILSADAKDFSNMIGGAGMDGGSFHHQKSVDVKTGAVITDGGSFERASSKCSNRV
jgi:membrane protein implicated in regulation of membrane protease activity